MINTTTITGISYSEPTVILLQETGIGTSEFAGRTAYDSFDKSENINIKYLDSISKDYDSNSTVIHNAVSAIHNIESSELLSSLAWVHQHHSVIEHCNLTYLIKGTSRGVLQEHARHRLQSITVRSTRYTMSSVINAFLASLKGPNSNIFFVNTLLSMNLFVTTSVEYNRIEIQMIYNKLQYQLSLLGMDKFRDLACSKSSLHYLDGVRQQQEVFDLLEAGKKKRNVGDAFKHIVTDNWKVDMVVTMNLRALKNYLTLRDSGAAYFQIRWLAQAMIKATPSKYLELIIKKNNKQITKLEE